MHERTDIRERRTVTRNNSTPRTFTMEDGGEDGEDGGDHACGDHACGDNKHKGARRSVAAKKKHTCVKRCFKPATRDSELVMDVVDELVEHITKISTRGSLVALLTVHRMLAAGKPLPDDFLCEHQDTFFDQCFKTGLIRDQQPEILQRSTTVGYIADTVRMFSEPLRDLAVERLPGDRQAITYASIAFKTNFVNHVEVNFEKRLARYVTTVGKRFFPRGRWPTGQKRRALNFVSRVDIEVEPPAVPPEVLIPLLKLRDKHAELLGPLSTCERTIAVRKMMAGVQVGTEHPLRDNRRLKAAYHLRFLRKMELAMWILRRVNAWGGKGFSMTPVVGFTRKHVVIDPVVFTEFVAPRLAERGYYGPAIEEALRDAEIVRAESGSVLREYNAARRKARRDIRREAKTKRRQTMETVESKRMGDVFDLLPRGKESWTMNNAFRTDGYSLCVPMHKDEPPLARKERLLEGCLEEVPPGREVVGDDTGVKNTHYVSSDTWSMSLTGRRYYMDGHINKLNAMAMRRQKRESSAIDVLSTTTRRHHSLHYVVDYVTVVANKSFELRRAHGGKDMARARMDTHIHKASCLDGFMTKVKKRSKNAVLAIGCPNYNCNIRGCRSVPTKSAFQRAKRIMDTVPVDENMTSQICPFCDSRLEKPYKITPTGRRVEVRGLRLCGSTECRSRFGHHVYTRDQELWPGYVRLSRDKVGAKNIRRCAGKQNHERPLPLRRRFG